MSFDCLFWFYFGCLLWVVWLVFWLIWPVVEISVAE